MCHRKIGKEKNVAILEEFAVILAIKREIMSFAVFLLNCCNICVDIGKSYNNFLEIFPAQFGNGEEEAKLHKEMKKLAEFLLSVVTIRINRKGSEIESHSYVIVQGHLSPLT